MHPPACKSTQMHHLAKSAHQHRLTCRSQSFPICSHTYAINVLFFVGPKLTKTFNTLTRQAVFDLIAFTMELGRGSLTDGSGEAEDETKHTYEENGDYMPQLRLLHKQKAYSQEASRSVLLVFGSLQSFTSAGLIFGYTALATALMREGRYTYVSFPQEMELIVCTAQENTASCVVQMKKAGVQRSSYSTGAQCYRPLILNLSRTTA
jgi:hypothetical protein